MTRDLRTNLFTEPRTRTVREHWARAWAGIQQADVCNRGAAVEADAIGRAAVEADAIGRAAVGNWGVTAEADVIGSSS